MPGLRVQKTVKTVCPVLKLITEGLRHGVIVNYTVKTPPYCELFKMCLRYAKIEEFEATMASSNR